MVEQLFFFNITNFALEVKESIDNEKVTKKLLSLNFYLSSGCKIGIPFGFLTNDEVGNSKVIEKAKKWYNHIMLANTLNIRWIKINPHKDPDNCEWAEPIGRGYKTFSYDNVGEFPKEGEQEVE